MTAETFLNQLRDVVLMIEQAAARTMLIKHAEWTSYTVIQTTSLFATDGCCSITPIFYHDSVTTPNRVSKPASSFPLIETTPQQTNGDIGSCYQCDEEETFGEPGNCGEPDITTDVAHNCSVCFLQVSNMRNEYYDIDRGCGMCNIVHVQQLCNIVHAYIYKLPVISEDTTQSNSVSLFTEHFCYSGDLCNSLDMSASKVTLASLCSTLLLALIILI